MLAVRPGSLLAARSRSAWVAPRAGCATRIRPFALSRPSFHPRLLAASSPIQFPALARRAKLQSTAAVTRKFSSFVKVKHRADKLMESVERVVQNNPIKVMFAAAGTSAAILNYVSQPFNPFVTTMAALVGLVIGWELRYGPKAALLMVGTVTVILCFAYAFHLLFSKQE